MMWMMMLMSMSGSDVEWQRQVATYDNVDDNVAYDVGNYLK